MRHEIATGLVPDFEAKDRYAAAWRAWMVETEPDAKAHLERVMDSLQPSIAPGPGPEWDAFRDTLPLYNEFWVGFRDRALAAAARPGPGDGEE